MKMSRCEDEQMWRWADVREGVKMSRCEDEQMCRCEDEQMWEKMREKMWEKRWRWADVSRCEDEQMWRWEGVKMRRWEDEIQMWRCEDEKMRRWEDEILLQTPTIGRTLRSDALGKKHNANVSRLFYLFARLDLFSSDFFLLCSSFFSLSLLWLFPPLLLHLSILPEVWLLNCLRTYFFFACFILLRSAVCLWGHHASWGHLGHEVD